MERHYEQLKNRRYKMKFMEFNRCRVDLTPIKVFISIIAVYIACMTSIASAAITTPTFDRKIDSVFANDLKSCPVPYSVEYCSKEDALNSCQSSEPSWLPILNKYTLQSHTMKPFCPFKILQQTMSRNSVSFLSGGE